MQYKDLGVGRNTKINKTCLTEEFRVKLSRKGVSNHNAMKGVIQRQITGALGKQVWE